MDGMFDDAVGMAATGVGLGILTMGAMVPIAAMQKMVNESPKKKKGKKAKKGAIPTITVPKLQF
jgi:hypothetical protein